MNFIIVLLFAVVPVHTCTTAFGTEEDQAIFQERRNHQNHLCLGRTVSGDKLSYSSDYLSPTAKRHGVCWCFDVVPCVRHSGSNRVTLNVF